MVWKIFMFLLGLMLLMQSVLVFYYSLYFMMFKLSYYFQWEVISLNSFSIEMVILIDWMSLLFLSVVLLVSSMVMLYSLEYMAGDLNKFRFFKLLFMFVLSMVFLIISPNMMSILIGWDGLGLISYCLVIYYSSYTSYNYGMITFICNRVGDLGILMLISLLMMNGSWNLIFYDFGGGLISFFLVLSSMTKSAQIPFSTWLPKAMAAPTPVSSLVHSSTLVTAGIYLLIRYNYLFIDSFSSVLLMILSSMTMLMSGLAAMVDNDLKKIIAFSTLSQLGLMMSILSLGQSMLAFFHLLTHAMFKSLLFLSSGCIIHNFKGNQDVRLMGSLIKFLPFTVFVFFCALLSLSGFPFLSGFYSKDLILEFMLMNKVNFICALMLFFGTILTVSYSVRLMMFMVFGQGKLFSVNMFKENSMMEYSMVVLTILSVMGGSVLSGLYFDKEDVIILDIFSKLLVVFMFFTGVFLGCLFYYVGYSFLFSFLDFFGGMWYMDNLIKFIVNLINYMSSSFINFDSVWLEYNYLNLYKFLLDSFKFKYLGFSMFNFVQFFVSVIILLFCYY